MAKQFIITGSTGFLGSTILRTLTERYPKAQIDSIPSPSCGGPNLCSPQIGAYFENNIRVKNPEDTVLVHAAASVKWNSIEGLTDNASMSHFLANWSMKNKIGFNIFISGVNVYSLKLESADITTPCEPSNLYGLGKQCAERIWELSVPSENLAILRLAGIWGWQKKPTLFWNRILLNARFNTLQGGAYTEQIKVKRLKSNRNYISDIESSECVSFLAANRLKGKFLGAGLESVSTEQFLNEVNKLPGSNPDLVIEDDQNTDTQLYKHSPELRNCLLPFDHCLRKIWSQTPPWM